VERFAHVHGTVEGREKDRGKPRNQRRDIIVCPRHFFLSEYEAHSNLVIYLPESEKKKMKGLFVELEEKRQEVLYACLAEHLHIKRIYKALGNVWICTAIKRGQRQPMAGVFLTKEDAENTFSAWQLFEGLSEPLYECVSAESVGIDRIKEHVSKAIKRSFIKELDKSLEPLLQYQQQDSKGRVWSFVWKNGMLKTLYVDDSDVWYRTVSEGDDDNLHFVLGYANETLVIKGFRRFDHVTVIYFDENRGTSEWRVIE
jgi:hypothetical protein